MMVVIGSAGLLVGITQDPCKVMCDPGGETNVTMVMQIIITPEHRTKYSTFIVHIANYIFPIIMFPYF